MPTRPATPSDIPSLLPMVRALCDLHHSWDPDRYDFLPDIIARYEYWLPQRAADPRSVFLVAEAPPHPRPASMGRGGRGLARTERGVPAPEPTSESVPVGFLIATIEQSIPIYQTKEYAFIHDLWIDPPHRRDGLARELVDAALARFRALGLTQVRLETATANEDARRLFQSAGFRVSTIDMLRTL